MRFGSRPDGKGRRQVICILLQSMPHPTSVLKVKSKIIVQTYFGLHPPVKTSAFDLLNLDSPSSNFLSESTLDAKPFWRYGLEE